MRLQPLLSSFPAADVGTLLLYGLDDCPEILEREQANATSTSTSSAPSVSPSEVGLRLRQHERSLDRLAVPTALSQAWRLAHCAVYERH